MPFPKKTPRERGSVPTWTWFEVVPEAKFKAWIAGPCEWVETHFIGQHKPCREALTDGGMGCPVHSLYRCELTGYLPLWDQSHKPIVIIVKEYSYDAIEKIKHGTEVLVTRGPNEKDPTVVMPTLSKNRWVASDPKRQRPQFIDRWLLVLWKDGDLRDWMHANSPCRAPVSSETDTPEVKPTVASQLEEPIPTMRDLGMDETFDLVKLRNDSVLSEAHMRKYVAARERLMAKQQRNGTTKEVNRNGTH